jgi:hypothetical protein
MAAADLGPIVVVNVSSYRCDVFIIERRSIKALELPGLSLNKAEQRAMVLASNLVLTLAWLWDIVVCPCLEALGFKESPSNGDWPRVWWSVTGPLRHLLLYAAGRYNKRLTETVLDRVMSLYSSSVKALIYCRRDRTWKSPQPTPKNAILVNMKETHGKAVLPFVSHEIAILSSLCPLLGLKLVKPPKLRKEVLAELPTCEIFYFAGHGLPDLYDPLQSCLLLEDWMENPLTIGDLLDLWLVENSPFLAYLSAYSTGVIKGEKLINEEIHLVSAC